ncbi:MAG TPA: aminodeoxychorismate/anthranilate synthase component II [Bacteroidales bacterium]|nr:aminodeoxychorismate/anthranilate synthase component II [Bacteroidales bacterium]
MKIMVLDNYDSFTFNLVHYIRELTGEGVDVFRNDKITIADAEKYDKIVISPGPGLPLDAGITLDLIRLLAPEKSIFGVCLGCQAIAEAYGGRLTNLRQVYHGVATRMTVTDQDERLFEGVPGNFTAGRYHSWVISDEDLPSELIVTARDEQGTIMALAHKEFNLRGVQFHPESVLTRYGKQMMMNWLEI